MKAPDKIYIEIDGNRVHTYFGLQPEKAVEYIRKDDLLYWLKLKRFETPGAGEEYQEVINYINSL